MSRRKFVRTHVDSAHLVGDEYMGRLTLHESEESARAYIEWDFAQYGHRCNDAYLRYWGESPIMRHVDGGPIPRD